MKNPLNLICNLYKKILRLHKKVEKENYRDINQKVYKIFKNTKLSEKNYKKVQF